MKKIYSKLLILALVFCSFNSNAQNYRYLVGTYTVNTASKGIYSVDIQPLKKTFQIKSIQGQIVNPSFLAISKDQKNVYAVAENGKNSKLHSFEFNVKTGKLKLINAVDAQGEDPCFISSNGDYLFAANYSSGNLSVAHLNSNRSISSDVLTIQYNGKSIDSDRQKASHLHQCIFSADGKYLFTNNLGTDFTHVYSFNPMSKPVLQISDSILAVQGGGPRHLVIHPNGNKIYVLNELDGTIAILNFQQGKLRLSAITSVVTKENGKSGAADIHISGDGKYLYATNRANYNDISCFSILPDGNLKLMQQFSTQGIAPRNFAISRDDKFIFIANQKSNKIAVFKRNQQNGKLTFTGFQLSIPAPVCLIQY